MDETSFVLLEPIEGELAELTRRLDRDFLAAASSLNGNQLRVLVYHYEELQRLRISLGNAATALEKSERPATFLRALAKTLQQIESRIVRVMQDWSLEYPVGEWALAQKGVGPTTVAALLAYLDVDKCKTAASVWRYCGLDPTLESRRSTAEGQRYNHRLKRACYLLGQSFRYRANDPECFYGQIYRARKAYETERNEQGAYAEQARERLAQALERGHRIAPSQREAWSAGKLTAAHIDQRARRYAVKLFLAHFAWVYWETERGTPYPAPYAVALLGHADVIAPPGYEPLPRAA